MNRFRKMPSMTLSLLGARWVSKSGLWCWTILFVLKLLAIPEAGAGALHDASVHMQFSRTAGLQPGDRVSLTITVSNAGPDATSEALVAVLAPPWEEFALRYLQVQDGVCAPFSLDLAPVTWNLHWRVPPLTAGQSLACTVELEITNFIPESETLPLAAYFLSGDPGDTNQSDNEDLVTLIFGVPQAAVPVPGLAGSGVWLLVILLIATTVLGRKRARAR